MQQRMQPLKILVVRPGLEILPSSMCFCSACTCEYAASRARLLCCGGEDAGNQPFRTVKEDPQDN